MAVNQEVKSVLREFRGLKFNSDDHSLVGIIEIEENDSYDLKISLCSYPRSFPEVWETSERIPRELHRHTYSDTGSLCFTTAAKAQILLKTKIKSLRSFLKEILVPYLKNNSFYELNGYYSFDEYSHNGFGVIEGYQDIFGIRNPSIIEELIVERYSDIERQNSSPCYCGSGKSLMTCSSGLHYRSYRRFLLIEKNVLYYDLVNTFFSLKRKHG